MSLTARERFDRLPNFVSVDEAAAFLGVSRDTVYGYYRRGLLKGFRTNDSTGRYRINKDSLGILANIPRDDEER